MVWDGDCNFCRRWIERWKQATDDRVDYLPFQDASIAARFPEIPCEQYEQAVQLIETDGNVYSAAEAVFRSLTYARHAGWMYALYRGLPGFAPLTEWFYGIVARRRSFFSMLTRLFWGQHLEQPTHHLVRWVFLRMLGIIYLIAFVSLWTQINGLIGDHGILPAKEYMETAHDWAQREGLGWQRFWELPTLCWFDASGHFLNLLCGGGVIVAVLLVIGMAPPLALFLLWLLYLSLSIVGREFLSFQWDSLLLETGFLAIFFAPMQILPRSRRREEAAPSLRRGLPEAPPSRLMLWMLRWLLFRLMFSSGVIKLTSGDPAWRNLSALEFHYETQPLPTWIGWYAHQLPDWFHQLSCMIMFGIELVVPFFIFAPRRPRLIACCILVVFQLLIAITGNYCFFNWLTISLCVLLLDDAAIKVADDVRRRIRLLNWQAQSSAPPPHVGGYHFRWPGWIIAPMAVAILLVSIVPLVWTFRAEMRWPAPLLVLHSWISPFRSVNNYGLFAVMTTSRPEIIIEGSNDGEAWKPYEFKYKPGDPKHRPSFVAPHQPRLDWQMWFAALGRYQGNVWLLHFCERLLSGSPEVVALMGHNPFPNAPPRYIRAMLYDYRFTDFAMRRKEGTWWRRERKGPYCPVLSLKDAKFDQSPTQR